MGYTLTPRSTQILIRDFFYKYKIPYQIKVDGHWGPKSKEAARVAQLCLGWKPKYAKGVRSNHFYNALKHPLSHSVLKPIQIKRGLAFRRKLRTFHAKYPKNNSTPIRIRAFRVAESLLGTKETGYNSGPMVNKIIYSGGGWATGLEWCGLFVAYCYRNAGYKKTTWRWMRVWEYGKFGVKKTKNPQQGNLVRFKFGHIGLFDKWLTKTTFLTIEGNTSSGSQQGVFIKRRHISDVYDFLEVL